MSQARINLPVSPDRAEEKGRNVIQVVVRRFDGDVVQPGDYSGRGVIRTKSDQRWIHTGGNRGRKEGLPSQSYIGAQGERQPFYQLAGETRSEKSELGAHLVPIRKDGHLEHGAPRGQETVESGRPVMHHPKRQS